MASENSINSKNSLYERITKLKDGTDEGRGYNDIKDIKSKYKDSVDCKGYKDSKDSNDIKDQG